MKLDTKPARIVPNNQMSESEYRNLAGRISSSDIRTFLKSRKKFYNQCVLGYKDDDKDESVSMTLGNIADCILTCGQEELDKRFVISTAGVPKGQLGELCEALYKRAMKSMRKEEDDTYTQTCSFEDIFTDAMNAVKYDRSLKEVKFVGKNLAKILELFTVPDKDGVVAENYYKEKLECIGKTVVDADMLASGEKLANDLRASEYTSEIINAESTSDREIHNQLIILFTYKGIELRAMLDKVEINHKKKYIQPYDIKTTYDNEGFEYMYLKGLYIQAATYDKALQKWALEHNLDDYEILPMKYPVADTANENVPLMYSLTADDIRRAYTGFKLKGSSKWYEGLDSALDSIKWHVDTGNWKISKWAYERKGNLTLDVEYQ